MNENWFHRVRPDGHTEMTIRILPGIILLVVNTGIDQFEAYLLQQSITRKAQKTIEHFPYIQAENQAAAKQTAIVLATAYTMTQTNQARNLLQMLSLTPSEQWRKSSNGRTPNAHTLELTETIKLRCNKVRQNTFEIKLYKLQSHQRDIIFLKTFIAYDPTSACETGYQLTHRYLNEQIEHWGKLSDALTKISAREVIVHV